MNRNYLAPFAAIALLATPAIASAHEMAHQAQATMQAQEQPQASIPFANSTGIWDWRPGPNDRTLYLEDNFGQWYEATLMSPAVGMNFTEHLGIAAGPTGTLDNFGAVYLQGQRYQLNSLVKVPTAQAEAG